MCDNESVDDADGDDDAADGDEDDIMMKQRTAVNDTDDLDGFMRTIQTHPSNR